MTKKSREALRRVRVFFTFRRNMARLPGLIAFLKSYTEYFQDDGDMHTLTLSDLYHQFENSAENSNDDNFKEYEIDKYPTEEIFDHALSQVPGLTRSKNQKNGITYFQFQFYMIFFPNLRFF